MRRDSSVPSTPPITSTTLRSTPTTVRRTLGPLNRCPAAELAPISSGDQNVTSSSSPTDTPDVEANSSFTAISSVAAGSGWRPAIMIGAPSSVNNSASSATTDPAGHVTSGADGADAVAPM